MKTLHKFISLLITSSFLLSACATQSAASPNNVHSNRPRELKPAFADSDLSTLVDGNNAFAFSLYQALRSENGNLILSPYSISLALAMTYAGARGETESQMVDVLHFDLGQTKTHPTFNALDLSLIEKPPVLGQDKDAEPMQLNIANAVWAEQTFPFLESFLDTIAENYGAGINLADFVNNFEPTRKEINDWVSKKTGDKINDLLPDGSLNTDTRMVLVNAIYFKADWLDQFDANDTRDNPFHLLDGTQVDVPMMSKGANIPYTSGDGYQAIELKYAGESAAMDIIVPDEGKFDNVESSLTGNSLKEILNKMQTTSIAISLPKFKFESSFGLSDTLTNMGMPNAFDRDQADFSGMTGKKDLFISSIIHKAFVAVDEDGTEAVAATAAIMEAAGAIMFEHTLTIDRPFIFAIRDLKSGQVLFIGRVLNPAQ